MGELTERGAIVRQDRGWLLLEAPAEPSVPEPVAAADVLVEEPTSLWQPEASARLSAEELRNQLQTTVTRLRSEHQARRESLGRRLAELAAAREELGASRRRIAQDSFSRRAPS